MNYINTLSFPGLGIDQFQVNEVAFSIAGHNLMWYGIIITFGIVLAFFYVLWRSKFEKIKLDDILDLGIFIIIFGMLGARLYYVFMCWDRYVVTGGYFFENLWDTIVNMASVRNGGMAIYGGLIAGTITAIIVAKIKKIKFTKFLDMLGPAAMLGQIMGRWGNFINAEAFGSKTDIFLRMGIMNSAGNMVYVHPTFLYESLWNLAGFIFINAVYKKKKFDGQMFLIYMTWYGLGRMFIEDMRTDSLMLGVFKISQVVAFVTFAAGLIMLIVYGVKAKNERLARGAYENIFLKDGKIEESEESEEDDGTSIKSVIISDDGVRRNSDEDIKIEDSVEDIRIEDFVEDSGYSEGNKESGDDNYGKNN